MMDSLAEIVSTFGTLIMAVMGIVVSIIPDLARRAERWVWVAAFVGVGLAVSGSSYYEVHSSNVVQQQIYNLATGGTGYVYLDVYKPGPSAKARFMLINPGEIPVFDVDIHFFSFNDTVDHPRTVIDINKNIVRPGITILDDTVGQSGYHGGIITTRGIQASEMLNIKSLDGDQPSREIQVYRHRDWSGGNHDTVPIFYHSY